MLPIFLFILGKLFSAITLALIVKEIAFNSSSTNIGKFQDLANKRVGTVQGTTSQQYLTLNAHIPAIPIVFNTVEDMISAFYASTSTIDALLYDAPILSYSIKQQKLTTGRTPNARLLPELLDTQPYGFVWKKDTSLDILKEFNGGILDVLRDTTLYNGFKERWLVSEDGTPEDSSNPASLIGIIIGTTMGLAVILYICKVIYIKYFRPKDGDIVRIEWTGFDRATRNIRTHIEKMVKEQYNTVHHTLSENDKRKISTEIERKIKGFDTWLKNHTDVIFDKTIESPSVNTYKQWICNSNYQLINAVGKRILCDIIDEGYKEGEQVYAKFNKEHEQSVSGRVSSVRDEEREDLFSGNTKHRDIHSYESLREVERLSIRNWGLILRLTEAVRGIQQLLDPKELKERARRQSVLGRNDDDHVPDFGHQQYDASKFVAELQKLQETTHQNGLGRYLHGHTSSRGPDNV